MKKLLFAFLLLGVACKPIEQIRFNDQYVNIRSTIVENPLNFLGKELHCLIENFKVPYKRYLISKVRLTIIYEIIFYFEDDIKVMVRFNSKKNGFNPVIGWRMPTDEDFEALKNEEIRSILITQKSDTIYIAAPKKDF